MPRDLLGALKRWIAEERSEFKHSQDEIDRMNYNALRLGLSVSLGLLFLLAVLSLCLESFYEYRMIYISSAASVFLLHLYYRRIRGHAAVTTGMYLFFLTAFLFTNYLSVGIKPASMGVSIIGFFLLAPLLVIDRFWRINASMLLFFSIFVISSFIWKSPSIAVDDTVTSGAFMLIGAIVGEYMKRVKLTNIESRRLLTIQTYTDALTGLANRRKSYERIAEDGSGTPIKGIIMIDIDHFKQYNDTYGHQKGDLCLQALGKVFLEAQEPLKLNVFRYGGEEFLAFYYGEPPELPQVASSLRDQVEALKIPFAASPFGVVTISVGFVSAGALHAQGYEALIHHADAALYCSKEAGRNAVTGYEDASMQAQRW